MKDATSAIEAALSELLAARQTLPEDLQAEIDQVIEQTRILLDSLTGAETTADAESDASA